MQTDRQTDAAKRFTPATVVGVIDDRIFSVAAPRVWNWLSNYLILECLIPSFKQNLEFLTCVRRLTHVIAIGWTSVCPSVTFWYCVKTAQPIVKLSGSPSLRTKIFFGIPMETPQRGR